jgi:hypothetical protein
MGSFGAGSYVVITGLPSYKDPTDIEIGEFESVQASEFDIEV